MPTCQFHTQILLYSESLSVVISSNTPQLLQSKNKWDVHWGNLSNTLSTSLFQFRQWINPAIDRRHSTTIAVSTNLHPTRYSCNSMICSIPRKGHALAVHDGHASCFLFLSQITHGWTWVADLHGMFFMSIKYRAAFSPHHASRSVARERID